MVCSLSNPFIIIPYSVFIHLRKTFKNLKIPISILSFMDGGLIITQNKSFDSSIAQLFCSYNVLSKLLDSFGLVIEHSKD